MRIVAIADTHRLHARLALPLGDVFIHAGDLGFADRPEHLVRACEWIRSLRHPVKIVVAGNHDGLLARTPARELLGEGIIYLQDAGVTVDGVRFWGSPWQPEFRSGGAFKLPRGQALAERWALIARDTDVLITHGPPVGFGDRTSDGVHAGCAELRARVQLVRPRLHLFGHIHEDGGAWLDNGTWFVNCTTCDAQRGATLIDLDTATGAIRVDTPPP